MTDPAKLIAIMQVILKELAETLSTAPEPTNEEADARADQLKGQIDRLGTVLHRREDHIRRQKALEKQNRENTRHR